MGSGLAWSYASNALDQLVAQRRAEALAEADRQEKIRQFNIGAAERARAHDLNLQIHQNALEQQAEQKRQIEADRAAATQSKFFEGMTPADEMGTLRTLNPQTAASALLSPYSGQVQRTIPTNDQGEWSGAPDVFRALPGRQWMEKRQESADKLALANAAREAKPPPKPDVLLDPTTGRVVSDLPTGAGTHVAPHPPQATPHYTVQPEFNENGIPTGRQFRVNSLTGEVSVAATPEGGARTKPGNASLETRLATAQANLKTTHDIIRQLQDPTFAAALGPLMGRLSAAKDQWGNAPEPYRKLMGDIESVALSSMAVHGMRSSEGAERIKAELAGINTPAALTSYLRGLTGFSRHLLEDSGRTVEPEPTGTQGTVPTAPSKYKVRVD